MRWLWLLNGAIAAAVVPPAQNLRAGDADGWLPGALHAVETAFGFLAPAPETKPTPNQTKPLLIMSDSDVTSCLTNPGRKLNEARSLLFSEQDSYVARPLSLANLTGPAMGCELKQLTDYPTADQGVLVVIPGLGTSDRAASVKKNMEWLKTQGVPYRCLIYIYNDLQLDPATVAPCEIVREAGYWITHMLQVKEHGVQPGERVVVWIDSVQLEADASLRSILDIMSANCVDAMALADNVRSVHHTFGIMKQVPGSTGRLVNYIEPNFNIFTSRAFSCYLGLMDVQVNDLGWGVDDVFPYQCTGGVVAVLDKWGQYKLQIGAYDYSQACGQKETYFNMHPDWYARLQPHNVMGSLESN